MNMMQLFILWGGYNLVLLPAFAGSLKRFCIVQGIFWWGVTIVLVLYWVPILLARAA